MDESKLMIIQLLQALDNGEVNFKQVPALTNVEDYITNSQISAVFKFCNSITVTATIVVMLIIIYIIEIASCD